MVEICVYTHPAGFETLPYPHNVRERMACSDCLIWVDARDPTGEELRWVQEQFDVHPIAMEDYNSPHERARIDSYPNLYSLVFFALRFDAETRTLTERPLTLFVGPRFLVTLHAHAFPEVPSARKLWEKKMARQGPAMDSGLALYALLDLLVDNYFPIIERWAEEVETIEDQVLAYGKPTELDKLFRIKRQYLYMRRAVAPERDVLNVLLRRELPILSESNRIYLQDVQDHLERVIDSLDTNRELLSGALDLYASVSVNHTMQVFTSWSIILMVASLIAGIYGMNFRYIPELSWHYGYEDALSIMIVVGAGLLLFFKKKGWL